MKIIQDLLKHYAFLLLLVLALALRLPLLSSSFWLDEAAQALESARPLNQQLKIVEDFQPPLLHIMTHFALRVDPTEWWLRTVGALVPALITIAFTCKLGELLWNKKIGLSSGLLLSTASFHIFYSQELRPYSLAACWAVVSYWLLARVIFANKNWSKSSIVAFSLLTSAGLYSTYLYPFVVISQLIFITLFEKKYLLQFCVGLIISGFLFAPWIPFFFEQLQVGQKLRLDLPGWETVVAIPQLKSLPLTLGKFLYGVIDISVNLPTVIFSLVIFATTGYLGWKRRKELLGDKKYLFVFTWLVAPIITAWLVSFFIPILQPKRVLFGLPPFYLLLSVLTLGQPKELLQIQRIARYIPQLLFILVLLTNCFGTFQYYLTQSYQRENWRLAHQLILEKYPKNSAVIFAFSDAFAPWRWYDDGKYPVFTTGSLVTTDTMLLEAQLKKSTEYSYLLVFDYLRDLTDPDKKIEFVLNGLGYTQKDLLVLPNIGFIRVYVRQEAVLS